MRPILPLAAGVGLMALIAGVHAFKLAGETVTAGRRLVTETSEQRRLDAYGDCGARGYGYLTRVLTRFPEPDAVPLVRYHGYDRFGALVLPFERTRTEDRVLVGVNLRPEDLAEQTLECRPAAGDPSSCITRADEDVDTLAGFRVAVGQSPAPGPSEIAVTLYDTPRRYRVLGRWTWPLAAGSVGQIALKLDRPLTPFSVHNRSIGFLVETAGASIARLDLLVRPVDARGYVVVHERNGCTTSVRQDLLTEARSLNGPWRAWLDSIGAAK